MVKTITLKNIEIYNEANALAEAFSQEDLKLPVKVNFFLQKNMKNIVEMAQEIDKSRIEIIKKFGTLDEETQQYNIEDSKVDEANKELQELFDLEQEVKLNMLDINLFDNIELTNSQVGAISIMLFDSEDAEE